MDKLYSSIGGIVIEIIGNSSRPRCVYYLDKKLKTLYLNKFVNWQKLILNINHVQRYVNILRQKDGTEKEDSDFEDEEAEMTQANNVEEDITSVTKKAL